MHVGAREDTEEEEGEEGEDGDVEVVEGGTRTRGRLYVYMHFDFRPCPVPFIIGFSRAFHFAFYNPDCTCTFTHE